MNNKRIIVRVRDKTIGNKDSNNNLRHKRVTTNKNQTQTLQVYKILT